MSPALAGWGATLSNGCGTKCASPQAVCEYWGNFYGGGCLGITGWEYLNGRIVGVKYSVLYTVAGGIRLDEVADAYCDAPYKVDYESATGCSLRQTSPSKQLGCNCEGVAFAGDPVLVNTGNLFESTTDFSTAGIQNLSFKRYYNSKGNSGSILGLGWRSNFDTSLDFMSSSPSKTVSIMVARPDGALLQFVKSNGVWNANDRDVVGTLATDGSTTWTYTDNNDISYTYAFSTGKLNSISWKSGYTQTLNYDPDGQLTSVSDTFGRSLLFAFADGVVQSITDPDGNVIAYHYDVGPISGHSDRLSSVVFPGANAPAVSYKYENATYPYALTGVVDENGKQFASWNYTDTSLAERSENAGGVNSTTFSYSLNSSGTGTVLVTNPLGKQSTYHIGYVGNVGKVTSITTAATAHTPATTESFTYDTNGFVASHTDRDGHVTRYTNNSRGQTTAETDGYGTAAARTINTTWDANLHVPTEVTEPGLTRTFQYDASGRLTQRTDTDTTTGTLPYSTNGESRTWSYAYTALGELQSVDGPLPGTGDTISFTYDAHGCVASVTDPLGHATTIGTVNGRCEPLTSTDANGVETDYTYDVRGRLTGVTRNPGANAAVTGFTLDPVGQIVSVSLPDGTSLAFSYDDARRLSSVTDDQNNSINYTLDAMGNRTAADIKDASGTLKKRQTATFDELGRLLQSIGASAQTTQYGYDAVGNQVSRTDPRNKVYGQTFDALNRLMTQTDPDTHVTGVAYNLKSEITSVKDARSLSTTYVRDGFGDIIERVSPNTGTTDYWYDAAGRLTKQVDARGIETDFTYDNANRVLTKTYPTDASENTTYTYDSAVAGNIGVGRLTEVNDASGSTKLTYNELGQIVVDQRTIGTQTYITGYSYDPAGHVLTITYPSGRLVTYTRDSAARITAVSTRQDSTASDQQVVTGGAYLPFGPLTGFNFGNGLSLALGYDQDYRLTNLTAGRDATAIQNLALGYDAAGNTLSVADAVASNRSQTFTYDDLNRLATGSGLYGARSYTYDGVGNRLTASDGTATETFSYPATSNRLTSVVTGPNTRSFSYLASGQVSQDIRTSTENYAFGYNNAGRMSTASRNGSTVGTYLYNALGQRVQKIDGSSTTQFVHDEQGHLIEEADASGKAIKEYVWLADLLVAMVDYNGSGPVLYAVHTDQIGRPQKLTDSAGAIAWDGVFDPFGNPTSITGPANTSLRFPGQFFDSETQLSQNWMRDYDPTIGRYIQSDPLGVAAGIDTYGYANGNPVSFTDQDGQELVGAAVGGLLGAINGGIGAYSAGGSAFDIAKGAFVGGAIGAGVGLLDPTGGVATAALIGGLAGGAENLAGQEIANYGQDKPLSCINVGSAAASTIGGAAGGALASAASRLAAGTVPSVAAAETAEEGITLYRGVDAAHPGYSNAINGVANPVGGDASIAEHVFGGNTASEYTSWTTDFSVAEGFATKESGSGVVIWKTFPSNSVIASPGNAAAMGESEFLVPGPVTGADTMRVPAWR
ncbi:RHS repeat-associated core domain-containing protein [Faunimonas pinastri]|nr:RHS repeat-associated core domain-containing protein [Faunimonas pinastri]